jgi:methyl-accepting chemotaxis protein
VAEHGIHSYNEAQDTMARIDGLSHSLTRTIGRLGEESKDIAKILAVISDVTERTKLLSLNASIIAAQSGEHGKGFAVVAQEMKLLSDQTAESTKSIVAILNGIQEGIGEAVEEAREASHTVKDGLAAVTVAGEALQEILDSSHGSSAMVRDIMDAAARQQVRLEEILNTMSMLQGLNSEVSRAMADEGGNIAELTRTFDILCESMDAARRAIEWQVATLKDVMGNVVSATSQTSGIARELEANDAENKAIDSSVQEVVAITARTTDTLNTASGKLLDVVSQMEVLVQEVKQFRT